MGRRRITKMSVLRAVAADPRGRSCHFAQWLGLATDMLVSRYLGLLERDGLVTADNDLTEAGSEVLRTGS